VSTELSQGISADLDPHEKQLPAFRVPRVSLVFDIRHRTNQTRGGIGEVYVMFNQAIPSSAWREHQIIRLIPYFLLRTQGDEEENTQWASDHAESILLLDQANPSDGYGSIRANDWSIQGSNHPATNPKKNQQENRLVRVANSSPDGYWFRERNRPPKTGWRPTIYTPGSAIPADDR